MRDNAARTRTGLNARVAAPASEDTRIRIDLAHLRRLESRAKSLSFLPRQPTRSVLNGRRASRMRGRGLNFEELRGYQPGDDVRSIDWKVTARTGEPYVRVHTEERDRPSLVVVDQRMSMFFGSRLNMKSVTAAETAALCAFRILDQGDRLGGIVFSDGMLGEVRPQRSRAALNRFLTALADANAQLTAEAPTREPMSLNQPLELVARIARRDHLVLVISDFDGTDERTKTLVDGLSRHNDVVLCLVTDPISREIPSDVRLIVSDGELQAEIDTGTARTRRAILDMSSGRLARVLDWQRVLGVPVLPLSAGEETLPQIVRLMGLAGGAR